MTENINIVVNISPAVCIASNAANEPSAKLSQSRSVLKVKALVGAVNQEKAIALEGAYSVIVKILPMVKMNQCDHFTLGESINNFAAVSIIFTFPRLSNLSIQDHINVIAGAVRGTNLPWLTLQIF